MTASMPPSPGGESPPFGADPAAPGGSADAGSSSDGRKRSPLDGLDTQFSELMAYLAYYVTAESDRVRWRLRTLVWRCALAIGAAVAALGVVATAAVFVLRGLAHGLGSWLGNRMWAGELIVGLAVFAVLAIAGSVVFLQARGRWRERILAKYEYYRQRQRAAFGRDVRGAAQRRDDGFARARGGNGPGGHRSQVPGDQNEPPERGRPA